MSQEVDPITLQVVGGALHSIAEQMGNVLYRMSYSSIIRESQDLGAGLFDTRFQTLCESDSTPMHIGSLPGYLRGIEKSIPLDAWKPGDCVIHNHPYFGASHSPDIAIVMPVFFEGELAGFSANTAHHVDIGAATPGLIIDVPDMYAEGMLMNGLKLYEEGKRNEFLWKYIRDNTRVPGLVMGDLEAQIASAELGVRRFQELLAKYGKAMVLQCCKQLMDYSEAALRRELTKIPDGDYVAEGFMDDDGRTRGVHLPVKVTVRVRGDSVEVDLTGSSPQVPTAFNVPLEGSTKVACYFAFRALLLDTYTLADQIPANEGSFRPVKVTAHSGRSTTRLRRSRRRHGSPRSSVSSISSSRHWRRWCRTNARPGMRRRFRLPRIPACGRAATTGYFSR
jgi:N-methylhydantoinase B